MGLKKYKPIIPTLRHRVAPDFKELTAPRPEKSLTLPLKKTGGRNIHGRITVRHRGGGHKRMYRVIDFKRDKINIPAKVVAIQYDPNRSSRIALLEYEDKERRYIIWPEGLNLGDTIISVRDNSAEIKVGNCLPLRHIPLGMPIHNLELNKGKGGLIVRGAGTQTVILAKEKDFAQVKLPSGEIRLISLDCVASIGQVGNIENKDVVLGKAGRSRWLGRRPSVRGSAMNPHDHPHGGGEGKSGQGNPHPVSPWGLPTKGFKTRKKHKYSDKYIIKRRK